jgi:hypothetical protein
MKSMKSMKIIFFFRGILPLVGASILLAGCSDDKIVTDVSSGRQIAFRPQDNLPATRATGTTVNVVNAFVVNGQAYDGSDLALSAPDDVLFDAQTVARVEGQANAFDYNPKRYYPDAAKWVHYSAYSPVSPNISVGMKGSKDNVIEYTVLPPDPANGTTRQEDLLVAYTKVEGAVQPGNGDAPVERKGFESSVPLHFKHALSRVFVKASNKNQEEVVITKLSLHNLYNQGRLDIDGTKWTDGPDAYTPAEVNYTSFEVDINEDYKASVTDDAHYKVLWTFEGFTQDHVYPYVLPASGISVAANTANEPKYIVSREQGMLVLPQATKNENPYGAVDADQDFFVEVTYSISNIKDKTVRAAFTDVYGREDGSKPLVFEFGKQYALNIEFSGTAVNFDIFVENWNTENEADAATTVIFAENRPANASHAVVSTITNNKSENFVYGQNIATTTGTDIIDKDIPTLIGWTFQGYFDEPVGGKKYFKSSTDKLAIDDIADWDKIGPIHTLYAQWVATTGDIAIDPNDPGVAGTPTEIPWKFDEVLPDIEWTGKPSKTGYDLAGLFTLDNAGDQIYDADGYNISSAVYNNVGQYSGKLYAQYTPKVFTVTIDLGGGTYDSGQLYWEQTFDAAPPALDKTKFKKEGFTFKGISTTSGGSADVLDENGDWQDTYVTTWTAGSTNVRLYVKWEEVIL